VLIERDEVVAYPMPALGDTLWFYYYTEGPARARIELYAVTGEIGPVLTAEHPGAGYQRVSWDIRNAAPGVYFYRLRLDGAAGARDYGVRKLVIVKRGR
jgi:hypothetical protein